MVEVLYTLFYQQINYQCSFVWDNGTLLRLLADLDIYAVIITVDKYFLCFD